MIIDAHSHLGYSEIFSAGITEELLLETMHAYDIDVSMVMPAAGSDPRSTHDAIANLAAQQPGRIFGMVSMTPLIGKSAYKHEAERCIREFGFKAIKLHPLAHAVSPVSEVSNVVFETADSLGVPVMVHTGTGAPFALPSLLIRRARQFPDLKIILAHAGFAIYSEEAIIAAEVCDNIYLEPTWCIAGDIRRMVKTISPERVMFGGDLPSNVPVELTKYRTLDLTEDERTWCLARTAQTVFDLPLSI
jgi:uncharacterized protein